MAGRPGLANHVAWADSEGRGFEAPPLPACLVGSGSRARHSLLARREEKAERRVPEPALPCPLHPSSGDHGCRGCGGDWRRGGRPGGRRAAQRDLHVAAQPAAAGPLHLPALQDRARGPAGLRRRRRRRAPSAAPPEAARLHPGRAPAVRWGPGPPHPHGHQRQGVRRHQRPQVLRAGYDAPSPPLPPGSPKGSRRQKKAPGWGLGLRDPGGGGDGPPSRRGGPGKADLVPTRRATHIGSGPPGLWRSHLESGGRAQSGRDYRFASLSRCRGGTWGDRGRKRGRFASPEARAGKRGGGRCRSRGNAEADDARVAMEECAGVGMCAEEGGSGQRLMSSQK